MRLFKMPSKNYTLSKWLFPLDFVGLLEKANIVGDVRQIYSIGCEQLNYVENWGFKIIRVTIMTNSNIKIFNVLLDFK
jgi:hypothetical protein